MLAVNDLHVNYGRVPALHGISLLRAARARRSRSSGPTGPGRRRRSLRSSASSRSQAGIDHLRGRFARGVTPEKIVRERNRARSGGAPHLREPDGGRESAARDERTTRTEAVSQPTIEKALERFPALGQYYHRSAGDTLGWGAAATGDRARAPLATASAAARRAVTRPRAARDRRRLRRARGVSARKA